MARQSKLVLLLLLSVGVCQLTLTLGSTINPNIKIVHDDIPDNELNSDEILLPDTTSNGLKISTPKVKDIPIKTTKQSSTSSSITHKPISDEIINDLFEASKHNVALADNLRFNKMLPEKMNVTASTKSEETYDDSYDEDNYDYDDDYNYDETSTTEKSTKKTEAEKSTSTTAKPESKKLDIKPIKEDKKVPSKTSKDESTKNTKTEIDDEYADDDDEDDDEDDDDDIDADIVFSENVPCPRYCTCTRNINSYLVATCSRFDPGTQKFGSDITDLIVTDVGPKYPILMGPKFFAEMGLKHVATIKISNCTIEYLHHEAFEGLDDLYSVTLINVGLAIINPDTFVQNKKLRMLTITGNDLSVMSSVHYLLKSSSIEELDFSRNNLMDLSPTAFSELSNIVYINLSQNSLQTIPEKVFDSVATIEELDLSYNSLKSLPPTIFNRTALAILHLKYNQFRGDLGFGTNDLQQLDISFNNIFQIHQGMFDKMVGLTNLNLKGNGITKIQPNSFISLKNLRHIDLSINDLDQISSMTFFKNTELDVIRLNDNPRLSQLPTDGFLSTNGFFNVYIVDISNCAIGALGHKTFSTMPHLTTLRLAWNNINNLDRDTFASLQKLSDLDLSNNLITNLDELLFMKNNELIKLNLSGNPLRKLSVRLFLPLSKLRDLDVSDCELHYLLTDNQFGVGRKYKFYETLRTFNASANQIKKISSADIKTFKNLRSLDISHNPLKCDEAFQDFISYVSLNGRTSPHKIPTMANLIEDAENFLQIDSQSGWSTLAHEVCKHHESLEKQNAKLDKKLQQKDKDLDEDAMKLWKIMEKGKFSGIMKDHKGNDDVGFLDEDSENDLNNAGEIEDDNYDDAQDDDDDEDEEDETNEDEDEEESLGKKLHDELMKHHIKDHGVRIDEIDLKKETNDKFLLDKLNPTINDDDYDEDNSEEEIIVEKGRIYYGGYRFLIPIIIMVTCVILILLVVAKIVSVIMHKRGERYRMALLASTKNSIVYQKLTEDIVKTAMKEPKQPKVHRYAPINQV